MFEKLQVTKIVENAERLNRIIGNIDNNLKQIAEIENHNFTMIQENFKELSGSIYDVKNDIKNLQEELQDGRNPNTTTTE